MSAKKRKADKTARVGPVSRAAVVMQVCILLLKSADFRCHQRRQGMRKDGPRLSLRQPNSSAANRMSQKAPPRGISFQSPTTTTVAIRIPQQPMAAVPSFTPLLGK
ncbi:hypothetical protein NPX13_g1947 [Xylaria arbuscula]|uniref:Uncharacterized protein n=1 Tax=Xylaria arbuscula TaxID=114810 RepID=A0A9W8TQV5_9PEZI|nr:hypothetical protein NPX13_g1947 [Xylaria arbuscula]